jgi:type II secretory pathway pseudopilin PulG
MQRSNRRRPGGGFTLVELVITIAIIMLILGAAVMSMGSLTNERRLREVTAELKDFAKKARAQAIVEQRAFQIEFQQTFFRVQALQQVGDEESAIQNLLLTEGEATRAQELRRFNLPDDIAVEILRWNTQEWKPAVAQRWIFEHTGICEPVAIRVRSLSGAGYIEMQFNPLTANVELESSEIL